MNQTADHIAREIQRRKTFAIISHPDAGKTTITEKLLLFGNAIHMAGQVKAKRSGHFATSDWMEIEKQRGISVASSVMQFPYRNHEINLLDTPGHQDFSEDTYRVLTAVDSALMVLDAAKGIETQTRKLFQVCRDRELPIMTFVNKLDRESKDFFALLDEVERELKLTCVPMTWPIGQSDYFKGVYDLQSKKIRLFAPNQKTLDFAQETIELDDPQISTRIDPELIAKLKEDLELIEHTYPTFDQELFLAGEITPVFFGSALNNFGVQELLDAFIHYAPSPTARPAESRMVQPTEPKFSGVIFKIQANMDPNHRDRCAFLRICSGEFKQGMNLYQVRNQRSFKLNNALQFMSQERKNVDEAFAGDIIGIHDRGNLMIGDTLTEGEDLQFTGIPQFSPEIFCAVVLKNPMKSKQLQKGLEQLSEEGASQMFRRKPGNDLIIGLVGQLQLEVVKFRLQKEYSAEADFHPMPYTLSRWFWCADKNKFEEFAKYYSQHVVYDVRDYPMVLLENDWKLNFAQQKFPEVQFFSSLIALERARK